MQNEIDGVVPHRNLDHAFPPFAPGVPMRSVYERAGFQVNPLSPRFGSETSRPSSRASGRSRKGTMTSDSERRLPHLAIIPPPQSPRRFVGGPMSPISPASTGTPRNGYFSPIDTKPAAAFETDRPTGSSSTPIRSNFGPMTPVDMPGDVIGIKFPITAVATTTSTKYGRELTSKTTDMSEWELAPPGPLNPQRYSAASSIYSNREDPVEDSPIVDQGTFDSAHIDSQGQGLGIDMNAPPPLSADSTGTSMAGLSSRSNSDARSLYSQVTSPSVSSGHRSNQSSVSNGGNSINSQSRKRIKLCRGCGDVIVGRAVASRDEGVSGKWHRDCFRCHACGSNFESGEFYALNDWPYCQSCYHYENGSLCQGCGFGIEGQCLEAYVPSGRPVRYHEHCLSCSECGVPLQDEHYSLNGAVYCAMHAGALDDVRLVEKRRTRLMMM